MDLPPGAARRTTYFLLSQFPDDAAAAAAANVLQRQSSGSSSYDASSSISASSDYPFHLQPPASVTAASPCKSWAQQAEETYQLQLALALRLCADAACATEPGFLDPGYSGSGRGSSNGRAFPPATETAIRAAVSNNSSTSKALRWH